MRTKILTWTGFFVILVGAGALAWWLMSFVSPNAARAWALLATVLLPFVAWAGWWFGATESRGMMAGLDKGVDRVMRAAAGAVGLTVQGARAMRPPRAVVQTQAPVVLPDIEIVPRALPSGRRDDVIEL